MPVKMSTHDVVTHIVDSESALGGASSARREHQGLSVPFAVLAPGREGGAVHADGKRRRTFASPTVP
jgi:hypothetical protein